MKRLVVNADDFGLTEMVNQGILECHQKGIVTSASLVANRMMSWLSGVRIHDFGTTFKAYRRDVLREIRLYSGHHRFIPALASWFGANITEIPIRNVVRVRGNSSYALSRTLNK